MTPQLTFRPGMRRDCPLEAVQPSIDKQNDVMMTCVHGIQEGLIHSTRSTHLQSAVLDPKSSFDAKLPDACRIWSKSL